MDTRNVIDHYKYWREDAIVADLDTKRHNFSVLVSNLAYDFNIGSVIRNANAFLAKEVIIYGSKRWDKRGAVGTYNYTHFKHVKAIDELEEIDGIWIGIDNVAGAVPIETFEWPSDKHIVMCFGQEQTGLPPEVRAKCESIAYITQYGSVRSLNVGCASSIAMYDYCRKVIRV